jgi:hypothetical protein
MPLIGLTVDEVKSLDLVSLVSRMDDVRRQAEEERHGSFRLQPASFPFPLVAQVMNTHKVRGLDEEVQRRIADATFRFLLQLDLLSVSSGIANREVFGPHYSDDRWASPLHWMKSAVLDQYQIIGSRVALECFFDLMHLVDRGTRMSGDRKFKAFRRWVLEEGNPFSYFVGHIVKAFSFDREHRQAEVHGTSRFARAILTLQKPTGEEQNLPLQLTNVLLSVWHPFLEILDGKKPSSIAVFDGTDNFAKRYFESHEDPEGFAQFLRGLITDRMTT